MAFELVDSVPCELNLQVVYHRKKWTLFSERVGISSFFLDIRSGFERWAVFPGGMINPIDYRLDKGDVFWYLIGSNFLLKVSSSSRLNSFSRIFVLASYFITYFITHSIIKFDSRLKIKNSHDFAMLSDYLMEGGVELWPDPRSS